MSLYNPKITPNRKPLRAVSSTAAFQHKRTSIGRVSKNSSPSLRATAAAERNRTASLHALTGTTMPATPLSASVAGHSLEVGDVVNVPGDMYGTVRFVGSVRGKAGRFVGVELDREFAARGKNDGDVDGYARADR